MTRATRRSPGGGLGTGSVELGAGLTTFKPSFTAAASTASPVVV